MGMAGRGAAPARDDRRYVALFLHKPLCPPAGQSHAARPWRYVVPAPAQRLATPLRGARLRLVVSATSTSTSATRSPT